MWTCPACPASPSVSLKQTDGCWRCENNHSYDIGKEGYVNLLLANQKHSKAPGDSKTMVNARRQFLNQGHYQPLLMTLGKLIEQNIPGDDLNLYDAGCGEGYYLHEISTYLTQQGCRVTAAGNDISRIAIQRAARKYPAAAFAVASNFHLPLAQASQRVLIQIFAPGASDEISRVLCRNGLWLQITPAAGHLFQLRQAVYEVPEEHTESLQIPDGFKQLEKQQLTFEFELEEISQRQDLLMMTPYYWAVEKKKQPGLLEKIPRLTADFSIRLLRKNTENVTQKADTQG